MLALWTLISMVDRLPGMHTACVDVLETQANRKQSDESCNNSLFNKTYTICNYYDCFELQITWPLGQCNVKEVFP